MMNDSLTFDDQKFSMANPIRQGIPMTTDERSWEPAPCGHCEGYGCTYCNKTGTVLVEAPKKPCHHCEGVGCFYCGFTGWTHPKGKYD